MFRRVAVLPLMPDKPGANLEAGRRLLEPIFISELRKSEAFEIQIVTPAQLQSWTGKGGWTAEEALPGDFLSAIQKQTGCDGTLFVKLTSFQAYPPLAVGWSAKIVSTTSNNVPAAVEAMFDWSNPNVRKAAKIYIDQQFGWKDVKSREEFQENSPSRFGQFAASQVVAKLCGREPPLKPEESDATKTKPPAK